MKLTIQSLSLLGNCVDQESQRVLVTQVPTVTLKTLSMVSILVSLAMEVATMDTLRTSSTQTAP